MAYGTIAELPENIRKMLPQNAVKLYLEAFNTAWQQYQERKYRENASREEVAHRRALSAVEQKFQKTETGWQEI